MKALIEKYIGGVIGGGIGLLAAILFLTIGFFRTLFIVLMMGLGFIIGYQPVRQAIAVSIGKIFRNREE